MADNLDDGEFWLPPQFLSDDDDDDDNNNKLPSFITKNDPVFDAFSRSLFSSPVESVVGSSETESEEEEQQLAELTRRVELDLNFNKGAFGWSSPQSTLSALGSTEKGSSPNGNVSQMNSQRSTWDLLHAAAGEVERMRLSGEHDKHERYGHQFLLDTPKPSPFGQRSEQQDSSLSQQRLQIAQFEMRRQQQMAKLQQRQMVPNRGKNNCNNNVRRTNNVGLSPIAWQQGKQQQVGTGMRAVFLGNPSGKRVSNGTGVFLPRCVDSANQSRKKPVCSTVLVPDRVAHALNLNLENMVGGGNVQHQQRRFVAGSNVENGSAAPRVRGNYYGLSQQKRTLSQQPPPVNHEIQLPQEWTY